MNSVQFCPDWWDTKALGPSSSLPIALVITTLYDISLLTDEGDLISDFYDGSFSLTKSSPQPWFSTLVPWCSHFI